MAPSSARGGLYWIIGMISSPKVLSGIGTGCSSPEVFKTCGCDTWGHFGLGNAELMIELLEGFFQPN